jgi:hypothetical protein
VANFGIDICRAKWPAELFNRHEGLVDSRSSIWYTVFTFTPQVDISVT